MGLCTEECAWDERGLTAVDFQRRRSDGSRLSVECIVPQGYDSPLGYKGGASLLSNRKMASLSFSLLHISTDDD
jgi:hypothetical protein